MATKIQQMYEIDFYLWISHNVDLIRARKLSEIDVEHLVEELECMGRNEKRELISCFAVLTAYLLKWKFQPECRENNLKYTIEEQRFELIDLLGESPSLKYELNKQLGHAYQKALLIAVKETGLPKETFPVHCPFPLKNILNQSFFPK